MYNNYFKMLSETVSIMKYSISKLQLAYMETKKTFKTLHTRLQNAISKSKTHTNITIRYSPVPKALLAPCNMLKIEPTCFSLATKFTKWRQGMDIEINALLCNDTRPVSWCAYR